MSGGKRIFHTDRNNRHSDSRNQNSRSRPPKRTNHSSSSYNQRDSKRPTLTETSHNQPKEPFWILQHKDLDEFIQGSNIYRLVRIIIPNKASEIIEAKIIQLQNDDNCKIIMPRSAGSDRNMFIFCTKESQAPPKRHNFNKNPMNQADVSCIQNLSNVVTRIATLIAPIVASEPYCYHLGDYTDTQAAATGENKVELRVLYSKYNTDYLFNPGPYSISSMEQTFGIAFKLNKNTCPKSNDKVMQVSGSAKSLYDTCTSLLYALRENNIDGFPGIKNFYDANDGFGTNLDYGNYITLPPLVDTINDSGYLAVQQQVVLPTQPLAPSLNQIDKSNLPYKAAGCMFIKILVPSLISGRVIGRGGSNIKMIKEKFKVNVITPGYVEESEPTDNVFIFYVNKSGLISKTNLVNAVDNAYSSFKGLLTLIIFFFPDRAVFMVIM